MAEPRSMSDRDINDILKQIKEEMMKRKQLRAQNETNSELKKLNTTLTSNSAQKKPEIKIPTARDITNTFIKSSPIFSRDFTNWVHDTARYTQSSNDELAAMNKGLQSLNVGGTDNSDQLEYLDMISDQITGLSAASKDHSDKNLQRLDTISTGIGKLVDGVTFDGNDSLKMFVRLGTIDDTLMRTSDDLIDSNEDFYHKSLTASDKLIRLGESTKSKIGRGLGQVVNQLVRLREDMGRDNAKMLGRMNEDKKDEGTTHPVASSVVPTDPRADQNGSTGAGFLAGALGMGALSMLKKVLFAPLALVRGLVGIFTSMTGITSLLGKAGKFLRIGPLALITSIFEFGKGFINAKEILGKGSVTIVDRVRAGVSELLGSFGDLFDWVGKIFGFDTDAGKMIREGWLKISQKPFEWLQSVVDWVKNDLFSGIDLNTSLVDIPGKVVDNLQKGLTDLVNWIGDGLVSAFDTAKKSMGGFIDDMKKGFAENVKKPFLNMINAITGAMFDVIGKFVDIIPDALGGAVARDKVEEMRKTMTIDVDPPEAKVETPAKPATQDKPQTEDVQRDPNQTVERKPQPETPEPKPAPRPDMPQPVQQPAPLVSPQLTLPLPEIKLPTQEATVVVPDGKTDPIPMSAATPQYGRAAMNTQEMKGAQQTTNVVNAPVIQNKNNINAPQNTTILNSPSLQPSNAANQTRDLWNW
ncbi:tail length tape measure protein [Erwinia phage vB_EamM-Bue1]|uniref:Tail length tape measure protein n=1 Tax=Erwinia phage vB_EamM-Bue1 TaxID=2099338 RepID=A0A2P1JU41_9CAUD|nr:tail length tape measure protein [Erwinia phage vB_EamM-Bue1]AVO22870.1 tail length tape measure protein [Erwinia phage vB_EamM-Bue1]